MCVCDNDKVVGKVNTNGRCALPLSLLLLFLMMIFRVCVCAVAADAANNAAAAEAQKKMFKTYSFLFQ